MLLPEQVVIPSVSHAGGFMQAVSDRAEIIVLSQSNLDELVKVKKICRRNPSLRLIIHVDMIKGLSQTEEGIIFLDNYLKPYGIISSHPQVIQAANKRGLLTIQRCFVFDEDSMLASKRLVEKGAPDYLQVMPGVLPKTIRVMKKQTGLPVLAGGLIRSAAEVQAAIDAGAAAVTTSAASLWQQTALRGISRG